MCIAKHYNSEATRKVTTLQTKCCSKLQWPTDWWIIALTIAAERVRRRTERDEAAGRRSVGPAGRPWHRL